MESNTDGLRDLSSGYDKAADFAAKVLCLAACLCLIYVLAGPSWVAAKGLASLGNDVMTTNAPALLSSLGALALAKYLKS